MNQIRELARGVSRHGSVGVGVGEAREDQLLGNPTLTVADVLLGRALEKVQLIRQFKRQALVYCRPPSCDILACETRLDVEPFLRSLNVFSKIAVVPWAAAALACHGNVVFEGAQGVLLDEKFGLEPHRTWTCCTFDNAASLLDEVDHRGDRINLGVLRSYATRHGAGPFPTEGSELKVIVPDAHNKTHRWMGQFRVGYFDAYLADAAISFCEETHEVYGLVVTHMDRVPSMKIAHGRCGDPFYGALWTGLPEYVDSENWDSQKFLARIEGMLGHRAAIESRGPTWRDKVSHLPY
jgi:adenylosuccinate synthase